MLPSVSGSAATVDDPGLSRESQLDLPRPSARIFDIDIDLAEPDEMLATIAGWARAGLTRRVMYVNAHVVNQTRSNPQLAAALGRADLVYCDGYGVRLAAHALDKPVPHRMTGADWIWDLASLCELGGQPMYLLGSEPPIGPRGGRQAGALVPPT